MFGVEFMHSVCRNNGANLDTISQFRPKKLLDHLRWNTAACKGHLQSRYPWRHFPESITDVKDSPLIEPGSCIEQSRCFTCFVLPTNEKTLLDATGNISNTIRVHVVSELQHCPDVAAYRVHSIRRADRPSKTRLVVETMPKTILQREVPRSPLFCFSAHRVNTPLLECVQRHHVGWVAC